MRNLTVFCLFLLLAHLIEAQENVLRVQKKKGGLVPQSGPVRAGIRLRAEDEKGGRPLSAAFQVRAVQSRKQVAGNGSPNRPFVFILERTDTLVVTTRATGYLDLEEVLFVACDTCATYEHVARLEKRPARPDVFMDLKVNDKIRLDNVYFDQSSYILRPESYPQLDKLVNTLKAYPRLKIEIAGHTDNVGDRRLNQALSENRARVIANYLRSSGVAEDRLRWVGYGDTRPAVANENGATRKQNRRVEFVVLEN